LFNDFQHFFIFFAAFLDVIVDPDLVALLRLSHLALLLDPALGGLGNRPSRSHTQSQLPVL